MIDDRADSNAGLTVSAGTFTGGAQSATNQTYGVGKAGTVNIGSYAMFMKVNSVTADGKSVDPIYQQNGSTTGLRVLMVQVRVKIIVILPSH